ncbi:hypothetical protein [Streptomyces sp. NPDC101234]|uniref:hypothetical protein n=1 Tax=Streptomyces sp. NPDC101234 TaxID=3366138 RepID=UPI00380652DB
MSFDDAGTPRQGESGGDGVEVLAEEAGEVLHGLGCVLIGLADPFQQEASALGQAMIEAISGLFGVHPSTAYAQVPIHPERLDGLS